SFGVTGIVTGQSLKFGDVEMPEEVVSKLGDSLISAITADQPDDSMIDILVVCNTELEYDYITACKQQIRDLAITDCWEYLGGFRANATSNEILRLAEMPFVTRIDVNSKGTLCMDTARFYTDVDWWTQENPTIDGDKDGSKTSYSKDDIVVAILDSGIDTGHYDLDGGKVIGWVDICGDINGQTHSMPYDDHGHGTHCASIAAGSGDGSSSYRGVARYAALVGVKMAKYNGYYETADAIAAFNWIIQYRSTFGIEIVSCSWGSTNYGEYDTVAMYADLLVENYGLVVCVAAGNYGPGIDTITSPGTAKYVITVGRATDPGEGGWSLYTSSSRGPCDDGRIKPDILAPGTDIKAAKKGTTNQYWEMSGTSMATPFVAGLSALWLDKDYSLRYPPSDYHPHPRVKKLLMASATDMPGDSDPGVDNSFGAGRIDAWDEVWFYSSDVSSLSSNAPTVLTYSWYEHSYSRYNEPLWVNDPSGGKDWYKIYCYSSLFIAITADGDPDLILRICLYDRYLGFIKQSTAGNYRSIGHTAQYSGVYYIRINVEQYSGDYYDIIIMTTPS
ncbi:MAG: S8 family serine peptidase, partial [Promethearchaeota archaeon]